MEKITPLNDDAILALPVAAAVMPAKNCQL
jgi:hypothetical protein